jgi:hypothetical protein
MTKPRKNLVNERFGRLIVVSQADDYFYPNGRRRTQWLCKCDCGKMVAVEQHNLISGNSKSCGCLNNELIKDRNTTHGDRYTRLYRIWSNIKSRCYNTNASTYPDYGGRGINMCNEWKDSYFAFKAWALNNGYKGENEFTIDRIDVNGNYEPDNCRWSTPKEQANNRRNTLSLNSKGESHTLSEWADIVGIKYHTLYARIYKLGWALDKALQ